jgi:hypothetical protein
LSLNALSLSDTGVYDVVVSNNLGAVTSAPVTFAVYRAPTITTPPSSQTVVTSGTATFSVAAAGDPAPSVQWRRNGLNIPGATSATLTLGNVSPDQAGIYTVFVSNPGGSVTSSNTVTLTVNPAAPVITSLASVPGVVGLPLFYQITTSALATSYGSTVLPEGLSLNTTTGLISGTPTKEGSTSATLSATNITDTRNKVVSFAITLPPPVISSRAAEIGRMGADFSFQVTTSKGDGSFSASGLPPGLSISPAGLISGKPEQAGVFEVILTASNSGGVTKGTFQITIEPPLNAPTFFGATTLSAVQGTEFAFTPAFSGGPFSENIIPEGLPEWLSVVNAPLGTVAGKPSATGTFIFSLKATNAGGSKSVAFTLVVNPAPSAPVIRSAATALATVGAPFNFTLVAQGTPGATSYQASGLPANGLSFDTSTGLISGTPTQPGTLTLQVSAANSVGTGPQSALIISVTPSPNAPVISSAPLATGRVGVALNYPLSAFPAPTSYVLTSGVLPSGLSLDPTSGAVTGTPTEVGEKRVWFAGVSSVYGRGFGMEVVFNIAPPATAPVINSNGTAAGQVGQSFLYEITATPTPDSFSTTVLPEGLARLPNSGVISGLPLKAGMYSVTLRASKGGEASDPKTLTITIHPAPATPIITSALTALGRVGTAFAYTAKASESPNSYVATGLPPGLSMAPSTGLISGTPTASGVFTAVLRAANAAGLGAEANLVFSISAALNAPAITSAPSVTGKVGAASGVSYQTIASPGPITGYALSGRLPLGLSFNTSTGLLSGNPAEAGLFNVQLTATSDGGTGNPQTLVINIAPSDNVPIIISPTTAYGTVGTAFTYSIAASASPAFPAAPFPAPYLLDAVNLPPGLAVNPSTGVIQGSPTTPGTYTSYLVGSNPAGTGQPRSLTVIIEPAPTAPVVNSVASVSAQAGVGFAYQITATEKPTSFEVLGAPAWMSVNSTTGALAGIPTSPGVFNVDLLAKNASGASKPLTLKLTIAAAALAPVVTSPREATGTVQSAFSYQITASVPTGGTAVSSYLATGLPSGLSISSATGLISGTPLASGTFSVLLVAKNSVGESLPVTLVLKINPNVTFNF